jgi:hypothetical protein
MVAEDFLQDQHVRQCNYGFSPEAERYWLENGGKPSNEIPLNKDAAKAIACNQRFPKTLSPNT